MYGATLGARSGKPGKSRYTCSTERGGCGGTSVSSAYVEPEAINFALTTLPTTDAGPEADRVAAEVHAAAAAELSAIATDRAVLNGAARLLPKSAMTAALGDLKRRERAAKAALARPVATALAQRAVAETIQARWDAYRAGDRRRGRVAPRRNRPRARQHHGRAVKAGLAETSSTPGGSPGTARCASVRRSSTSIHGHSGPPEAHGVEYPGHHGSMRPPCSPTSSRISRLGSTWFTQARTRRLLGTLLLTPRDTR